MSTANNSTAAQSSPKQWGGCREGSGGRARWGTANIVATVLAFVFFWPAGLFMVYWSVTGRHVRDLPGAACDLWSRLAVSWRGSHAVRDGVRSDNSVFNRFQQTQYDRISEIKEEIRERSRRFRQYRADARQRADEQEFSEFMASAPDRKEG